MREAGPRQELVAGFGEAGAEVHRAVEGLPEEEMSRPAIDGWSVKDHVIHMTVWHEFRFQEISRIARGGQSAYLVLPPEQIDDLNERLVAWRRHLPASQALADLDFARSLVIEAINGAPDDALRDERYGEVGLHGGIEHDLEHADTIRKWREKTGL